jgi:hypothetical protein
VQREQLGAARAVEGFGVRPAAPLAQPTTVLVVALAQAGGEEARRRRRLGRRPPARACPARRGLGSSRGSGEARRDAASAREVLGNFALLRASAEEIRLRRTRSARFWSSVCMPTCWPVWIAEYICAILFSRIRFLMAEVPIMISCAATRPEPSFSLHSVCEITATSDSDSIARTMSFSAAGKTSTTRSIVFAALDVCSVPNTRWPVSAAVSARRIVSRSRISPTEDRVRVLAQRRAQRVREAQRVRADLALVDEALLALVHELDRVLDGQDVAVLVLVEVVHHRRQRGALARAGRAGHQHHAARLERQLGEHLRRVQLLEREDLARDGAEHRAGAAVLVEGVDAKARQALDLEREVALQRVLVGLALRVVHDVVHHVVHLLVLERVDIDATHVAVHADHRRQARGQVQVEALFLTEKASSWVMSMGVRRAARAADSCGAGIMATIDCNLQQVTGALHALRDGASVPCKASRCWRSARPSRRGGARGAVRRAARFGENYVQEALDKMAALADLRRGSNGT